MRELLYLSILVLPLWSCGMPTGRGLPPASGDTTAPIRVPASTVRHDLRICVVQGDTVRTVPTTYVPQTGDTLIDGRPISQVFPDDAPPYARQAEWFKAREPIVFEGRAYYWNGPPVVLAPDEVRRVAVFRGIPLFAEADGAAGLGILLVPVRRGCGFQPYYHFSGGPIRGS